MTCGWTHKYTESTQWIICALCIVGMPWISFECNGFMCVVCVCVRGMWSYGAKVNANIRMPLPWYRTEFDILRCMAVAAAAGRWWRRTYVEFGFISNTRTIFEILFSIYVSLTSHLFSKEILPRLRVSTCDLNSNLVAGSFFFIK